MFPSVKNKVFQDIITGKLVSVKSQFGDEVYLDNGKSMNVMKLMDGTLYEEYIDPNNFLGASSLQTLAEKIKAIPNEVLNNLNENENESIIVSYDPEEEKRMLLEKARNMNPNTSAVSQVEMFKGLIDDDELYVVNNDVQKVNDTLTIAEPHINTSVTSSPTISKNIESSSQNHKVVDPMIEMFKNIKRKNDFKLTLNVDGKIPRPDFIEMMEDSYEVSLIDFLAQEFTNELLSNPQVIKEKIKNEIEKIVYQKDKEKKEKIPNEETKDKVSIPLKKVRKSKNKEENNDSSVTN